MKKENESENEAKKEFLVKNDIIFKEIFSKKGNETFLQDFLSGLLKRKIKKIEIIKDASLAKKVVLEKLGVIDIKATLDDETLLDIEMQMNYYSNMEDRLLYYSSKLISSQLKVKEVYGNLKPVIVIAILNYNIFKFKEYITESKTVIKGKEDYEIMKKLKFYFIELEKYREQAFNPDDKVSQWLAFIDGEDEERTSIAMEKNKEIKRANEEYKYLTGDEEIQRLAELSEKWERDYNSGMHDSFEMGVEKGIKKGRNEGRREGIRVGENKSKIEIVKEMLKENFDVKVISKITKLSVEEIEKLVK